MSDTATLTLADFLLARIAEDEAAAESAGHGYGHQPLGSPRNAGWTDLDLSANVRPHYDVRYLQRFDPARVKAECEAKRRIVELHKGWPVLAETEPAFSTNARDGDSVAFQVSKRLAWMTEQEYRIRFGDEPPTAPMLQAMAAVYADHPDYREEWRP